MVLQSEVALEALYTEVKHRLLRLIPFKIIILSVILLERDLAGKIHIFRDATLLHIDHYGQHLLHSVNVGLEELKLFLKHCQHMCENPGKISSAFRHHVAALFDVLPDGWQDKLRVYLAIALDKRLTKRCGHENPARVLHSHELPLDNVVDVSGDRGIGAYTVLLHLGNELGLCQVSWRLRLNYD